ncbi:MAG: hypothetical protein MUE78_13205 [Ilumatobacteraceae bacterium]|nr:hypothetical protein [Ilumatobacteraceae bacterium]
MVPPLAVVTSGPSSDTPSGRSPPWSSMLVVGAAPATMTADVVLVTVPCVVATVTGVGLGLEPPLLSCAAARPPMPRVAPATMPAAAIRANPGRVKVERTRCTVTSWGVRTEHR